MPNLVPLRLVISPLPPDFAGTPQDLSDAIEARAEIVTDQAYSLFVIGPTAPVSDEGPWFKNGVTPWVWDVGTGAYVPVILDSKSLRYVLTQTLPTDNTDYDVVFKLNPGSSPAGAPEDVLVWYNGAWTSVGINAAYLTANYYTQAQTNAAIAAAVGGVNRYPFRGEKAAASQPVTAGAGYLQVVFEAEDFDVGGNFASNAFTAPVSGYYHFTASLEIGLNSGSPTAIGFNLVFRKNGADEISFNHSRGNETGNDTFSNSCDIALTAGDTVDVTASVDATGASVFAIANDPSRTWFSGYMIQPI